MKVTQESTAQAYLKKLNKAQSELVDSKEQEIKKLNNVYNDKIKIAKAQGDIALSEAYDKNKVEILETLEQKEHRLSKIKEDFTSNQEKLQKEKLNLNEIHQRQVEDMNEVWSDKYATQFEKAKEKAVEINEQTIAQIADLSFQSDEQVKEVAHNAKIRGDEFSRDANKKLKSQQQQFLQSHRQEEKDFRDRLVLQKRDHLDKVDYIEGRNHVELDGRVKAHQAELQYLEGHHAETLKQKDLSFKQKFAQMDEAHNTILKRVQDRFDSELKSLVASHGKYKELQSDKLDDDFYNVTKLNPVLKDFGNEYILSMEMPSYEHEFVNLTAQERKLSLTLTRSFSDSTTDTDGSINKSKRSEVINKTFDISEIVDPRTIKRKYEDGILSFAIAKR